MDHTNPKTHNPHDAFIRAWLSKPTQLANFLGAYLSPEVIDTLDLSALVVEDGKSETRAVDTIAGHRGVLL